MARSHHRKAHKTNLRKYQHTQEGIDKVSRKSKVTGTFTVIGAIVGAAVGYFATDGVPLWIGIVAVAGAAAGWGIGRLMDKEG